MGYVPCQELLNLSLISLALGKISVGIPIFVLPTIRRKALAGKYRVACFLKKEEEEEESKKEYV